ncbi:hypothetical protein T439DRAFT_117016 [Meredithblackwellia eburnea MCA 4105]
MTLTDTKDYTSLFSNKNYTGSSDALSQFISASRKEKSVLDEVERFHVREEFKTDFRSVFAAFLHEWLKQQHSFTEPRSPSHWKVELEPCSNDHDQHGSMVYILHANVEMPQMLSYSRQRHGNHEDKFKTASRDPPQGQERRTLGIPGDDMGREGGGLDYVRPFKFDWRLQSDSKEILVPMLAIHRPQTSTEGDQRWSFRVAERQKYPNILGLFKTIEVSIYAPAPKIPKRHPSRTLQNIEPGLPKDDTRPAWVDEYNDQTERLRNFAAVPPPLFSRKNSAHLLSGTESLTSPHHVVHTPTNHRARPGHPPPVITSSIQHHSVDLIGNVPLGHHFNDETPFALQDIWAPVPRKSYRDNDLGPLPNPETWRHGTPQPLYTEGRRHSSKSSNNASPSLTRSASQDDETTSIPFYPPGAYENPREPPAPNPDKRIGVTQGDRERRPSKPLSIMTDLWLNRSKNALSGHSHGFPRSPVGPPPEGDFPPRKGSFDAMRSFLDTTMDKARVSMDMLRPALDSVQAATDEVKNGRSRKFGFIRKPPPGEPSTDAPGRRSVFEVQRRFGPGHLGNQWNKLSRRR